MHLSCVSVRFSPGLHRCSPMHLFARQHTQVRANHGSALGIAWMPRGPSASPLLFHSVDRSFTPDISQ